MNKFWQFRNAADGQGESGAELLLYGPISESSWWGDEITPKQFNDDLLALGDVKEIKVRINSPGGDVFAAAAIYNSLKQHPAQVHTYVDGLAASAASVIAMAGDRVTMPAASMMMIHNPITIAMGDAREMRATADVLDKVRDTIIEAYQSKTSMPRADIIGLMNSETWMTGQDAVSKGFADEVDSGHAVQASIKGRLMIVNGLGFDMGNWRTVPTALLDGDRTDQSDLTDRTIENTIAPSASAGITSSDSVTGQMEAQMDPMNTTPEAEPVVEPVTEPSAETVAEELADLASDEQEPVEVDAVAEAVKAERSRSAAIRALAPVGCEALVDAAINDGITAEAFAVKVLGSDEFKNSEKRAARLRDAAAVDGVSTSGSKTLSEDTIKNMDEKERQVRWPEIVAFYKAKRESGK
jgi:ATP-dependent Clp protease protease subunit